MNRRDVLGALGGVAVTRWGPANAAGTMLPAECIIPAKVGGGFDLTCKLAQRMLAADRNVTLSYLPGGIGAVAYTTMVTQRPAEPSTLVAFSSGSLLNIAQGKFGPHTELDARWLVVLGTDYGVVVVRKDSPYRSLRELLAALKTDSRTVVFGAGGTIGSQDWFKAALLARTAGVSHKSIRFVAFEGGGDALLALRGGHVSVVTGDAAELTGNEDDVRVLAVLSEQRLGGRLIGVPTAREQGADIVWPTARGFYLGPKVSDETYRGWVGVFRGAIGRPSFAADLAAHGLYPMTLMDEDLRTFIRSSMARYRHLVTEFGLAKR